MTAIYELCTTAGISVLLLGHPPKGQGNYSGSTAWEATVRQRFTLKRADNGLYLLKCEKANYIRVGQEIEMSKNDDGVFVETFTLDDEEDDFDFESLKASIHSEIKRYNQRNETISFSSNAAAFYVSQFRKTKFSKDYHAKDIYAAVRELRDENRLINDGKSQKILAV